MKSQELLEREFERAERCRKELFDKIGNGDGTNLKSEWEDYIYDNILRTDKEIHLSDIRLKIKQNFQFDEYGNETYYCDDTIRCVHKEEGIIIEHPEAEWQHQVRLCLDSLQKRGKADNPIPRSGYWIKVDLKEKCKILRTKAFKKLEERDKSLFSDAEKKEILYLINKEMKVRFWSDFSGIFEQITRDFNIDYKKYDCLAMWLDPELGLAKYDHELIIKIAKKFLN